MPVVCQAALVTLATQDFAVVVEFYQHLLNQQPQPHTPQRYAEFQLAGLRLGIFRPRREDQGEFANSCQSCLSLCLEVENLEEAIAHLTQLGYPPPGELITAAHGQEIYAYDPLGNRLILHQPPN
ncbi:glyoxalase [Neosynechococcus sphagnicola sy1]|uniref:Glyoxalase n=1 Tax=Neosynechococcus sphagnicola sy1 TaxID=1497020 RepID=A0A098TMN6_9CYAN|nr:VOC family protein [Neosynechococcus sphagnicola]KGF73575.1 glyoxalase [Neosynechococcus sphagnicola sy1]